MARTLFACAFLLLASSAAEADECAFKLVQSTIGEVSNLYLEQAASDKAVEAAKSPEQLLIVIPRGLAASARRGADRHQIATAECSNDAADVSGYITSWLSEYERIYTDKANAGRSFLLKEIDFNTLKVALAENVAAVDEHWKVLPQFVVGVTLATVGLDPVRPSGTALRLTAQQKQQLLTAVDAECSKLGGCSDERLKSGGLPAAVVVQRLMREHLRKPWALNGTALK